MIPIFICEDKKKQLEAISKIISNYVMIEDLEMQIVLTSHDPHEILNYIKENSVTGLYFLDVHLETDITGIELAAEIRKYDKRAALVFVTSDKDSLHLTFKYAVEPMKYIDKNNPDMKQEILDCINLAKERLLEDTTRQFVFKKGEKIISERYEDIMFFETVAGVKNSLEIVTKNRNMKFYDSLTKVEKKINHKNFYRFTGSVLLNFANIKEIRVDKREVEMKNGDICEGAPRRMVKLVAEFEAWNVENN